MKIPLINTKSSKVLITRDLCEEIDSGVTATKMCTLMSYDPKASDKIKSIKLQPIGFAFDYPDGCDFSDFDDDELASFARLIPEVKPYSIQM